MLRFDATRILRDVEEKAALILRQAAHDVFNISQQLVPVDKGDLKASGKVDVISPTKVRIGYGEEYAKYQEFGTSMMPAQPFLTPAFAQTESIIKSYASLARKFK
jgi:HK97 gp10 family phage protein